MKKYFTKKSIYIGLFAILYLIVAFSSFWHACAFFGLANNSWMSIILAFAFEVGQAAVLFSLLTSAKDRSRTMPWVLMVMFTIVQVIGNVFSSYKYLITNSVENLRYFKEPIFIWTDLPDDQTTVIITYIVGAILPICALLLTSMITNYLTDNEEEQKSLSLGIDNLLEKEKGPQNPPVILNDKEDFDEVYNNEDISSDDTDKVNIDNNNTEELKESSDKLLNESSEEKKKLEDEEIENNEKEPDDAENNESNDEDDGSNDENNSSDDSDKVNIDKKENNSHFINLN